MSYTKVQAWGWKWLRIGHERHWPYFVTRVLNDVGNYGIGGTVRERGRILLRTAWYRLFWTLGIGNVVYGLRRRLAEKHEVYFRPWELVYSAGARCRCGRGLAYWSTGFYLRDSPWYARSWVCDSVLTGRIRVGSIHHHCLSTPKEGEDHDAHPFNLYDIRSERQVWPHGRRKVLWGLLGDRYMTEREAGRTTRPKS
jgi:hypothetical protein